MYLYAQIPVLRRAAQGRCPPVRARALRQGLWLRLYHNMMNSYAVATRTASAIRIPYPYENEKPEDPLLELVAAYPDDPIREQAQYTAALWHEQAGSDIRRGPGSCERLIADRPESKWTADARRDLEQITRQAAVAFRTSGFQLAGAAAEAAGRFPQRRPSSSFERFA